MISARSLLDTATRLATAPVGLGIEVSQGAIDAAQQAQRALVTRGEQASLGLLDAIVARMMDEQVIDRVLERAEAAGVAQRVVDRMLEDGMIEQIADRVLSGSELERMLAAAFRSALPEEVIAQLLASEAVWILVDEIARSPSVTEAIAHQGTGFLEQVAGKTRDRSRRADARLQRIAERLSRHRPADSPAPDPGGISGSKQIPSGGLQ
jgi:uncharacterized membrane-anchored protein YjiN (DUF445 family)